jgi:hypothetical protein
MYSHPATLLTLGALAVVLLGASCAQGAGGDAEPEPLQVSPEQLLGSWEKRVRHGMPEAELGATLTLDMDGRGSATIVLALPLPHGRTSLVEGPMSANLTWSVQGDRFTRAYGPWQDAFGGIQIGDDDQQLLRVEDSYLIMRDPEHGDLTVRYRVPEQKQVIPFEESSVAIGDFSLSGAQLFKVEPEGSYQAAGEPALVTWKDEETGFINHLFSQHIEYFKPGGFFHASGGATIVEGNLMCRAPSTGSRMVLFLDRSNLMEDGTEVLLLQREPGEALKLRRATEEDLRVPDPTPLMRRLAGTWAMQTEPDEHGVFYHHQRTLDAQQRQISGFIDVRRYTEKPKYESLGHVLVFGDWRSDGDELVMRIRRYLPDHPELPSGGRTYSVQLEGEQLTLSRPGQDDVVLTRTELQPDPDCVNASEPVVFHEGRIPSPGF